MKKMWMLALGAVALAAALICWGGASLANASEEPVLTQQLECVVLAKSGRELVVKAGTELRTVYLAQTERASGSVAVQVGDLVYLETELHSDNTETLRKVKIITEGELTAQEAADVLAGGQNIPEIVAFSRQNAPAAAPAEAAASGSTADGTDTNTQPEP